jgi:hypothetical protein
MCRSKRDAVRLAVSLGRMQLRLGDDADVVLRDQAGKQVAHHHFASQHKP